MTWIFYAFLSALATALISIFTKIGLKDADQTLAVTLQSIIATALLILFSFVYKKMDSSTISSFNFQGWMFIVLGGVSTGLSWIFYFAGLKHALASRLTVIEPLTFVMIVLLSLWFLNEPMSTYMISGMICALVGIYLIVVG